MNSMLLGSKLRKLRINAGMKLKDLAERLGVTSTTVSGYENGNNCPSIEVLCRYKDVFNVDLNWLLGTEMDNDTMQMDLNQEDQEIVYKYKMLSEEEKIPLRQIIMIMYASHFKNDPE